MKMQNPLVSAICCTHNRPGFIRKAIELFQAQTWPNKELLIMDDGAVGSVPAGLPSNVRHIRIPKYTWVTEKHRQAFELVQGDLVATWDDDDWYSHERLAVQASKILDGQADATGFHVKLIVTVPEGRFWKWNRKTLDGWARRKTDDEIPFHDGTAMFRRSLLDGIPAEVRRGTQIGLLKAMRDRGARLVELPNDGAFAYIRHSGVGWNFDVRDLCDPADAPAWVTPEMVSFWTNPALAGEGGRRG